MEQQLDVMIVVIARACCMTMVCMTVDEWLVATIMHMVVTKEPLKNTN